METFMLNILQEAIDRARVFEMIFSYELALCGPAVIYNTLLKSLNQSSLEFANTHAGT
ncbi:14191_t:CDS:1, partial [Racocetra fulgida]